MMYCAQYLRGTHPSAAQIYVCVWIIQILICDLKKAVMIGLGVMCQELTAL
jgi:hypothetical protein